jgi:hypothetical protein
MKRTLRNYLIQYVLLPAVLILSDIFIGLFAHYGGKMGFTNIFSFENISYYITNHVSDILFVVLIAIGVCFIVEYIVRDIEKNKSKRK